MRRPEPYPMNFQNLPHPGFFAVFHRGKEFFRAKIANYLVFIRNLDKYLTGLTGRGGEPPPGTPGGGAPPTLPAGLRPAAAALTNLPEEVSWLKDKLKFILEVRNDQLRRLP
jgi:hypothetical protein